MRNHDLISEARARALGKRTELLLGLGPISDVFSLLEREGIVVVRYPVDDPGLSAVFLRTQDTQAILVNTARTLGHQIFSAAHEASHAWFDSDMDMEVYSGQDPEGDDQREQLADAFAAEFLMPPQSVEHLVSSIVMGSPRRFRWEPWWVVVIQQYFKVSYAAALKRLKELGFIAPGQAAELRRWGDLDHAEALRCLTEVLGYDSRLIQPTREVRLPPSLLCSALDNYSHGRISTSKLMELFRLSGQSPEDLEALTDNVLSHIKVED